VAEDCFRFDSFLFRGRDRTRKFGGSEAGEAALVLSAQAGWLRNGLHDRAVRAKVPGAPNSNDREVAMETRRYFIRPDNGHWIFGRGDSPFASGLTKEAAMKLAERFIRQHPQSELVIERWTPKKAARV
jgi:hypothetical protein